MSLGSSWRKGRGEALDTSETDLNFFLPKPSFGHPGSLLDLAFHVHLC